MPQFNAGESKTAKATMHNPKGVAFDYTGFLNIGETQVAEVAFHLDAGEQKEVSFPITIPSTSGTFPVLLYVYSGGEGIALYQATEDVVIVEAASPGITDIVLSPTSLTSARHEYETSLGLGYWGDPFTIGITFTNPLDTDIWLRPDFALGKLSGGTPQIVEGVVNGFSAESLLYFRLLLNTAAIQGDYSYTSDWQQPYDARGTNKLSNMVLGIYDPDGVPRLVGAADYWVKIPPKGSVATSMQAHLGSDLGVKAWQCTTCGEIITGGVEAHYASKHPGIAITCWSYAGLSGCYIDATSESAAIQVYVTADWVAGTWDLCVVAWQAYYFVYDPAYGQQRVGSTWVTVNWRPTALVPAVTVIPNLVTIT